MICECAKCEEILDLEDFELKQDGGQFYFQCLCCNHRSDVFSEEDLPETLVELMVSTGFANACVKDDFKQDDPKQEDTINACY